MHILLLGANGQLGWELHRSLATLGELTALDFPEIDFTHPDTLRQIVRDIRPQAIFNATAYTAVNQAESEPEITMAINGRGPGLLAEMASETGAALIHYSTDYVFDGTKTTPYIEADLPNPLNVYGRTKLAGEQAVAEVDGAFLILRTSWVYSLRRDCFVTKVLSWSRRNRVLRLATDQTASPTWARMLAEMSSQVLARADQDLFSWIKERKGIYHLAGDGCASRLQFGEAILRNDPYKEEQLTKEIQPALAVEFPAPAQRPLFSALSCTRFVNTFGLRLPAWEFALQLAMQKI